VGFFPDFAVVANFALRCRISNSVGYPNNVNKEVAQNEAILRAILRDY
jgi:hypothetical protein